MPQRLTLADFLLSRGPEAVGKCQGDVLGCAAILNAAQERLMTCREVSDAGWWGTYAEMAFNVSRVDPYLTTPRDVARIEYVTVCNRPVPIQNIFYEFLEFGDGHFPKNACPVNRCEMPQWYARNNVATFVDLIPGELIRVYCAEADVGKRVFISGTDNNDQIVTNLDGLTQVNGEFVTMAAPFADTLTHWNAISGVQKDVTIEAVRLYGVNPDTGAQRLLLTMQSSEKTGWYRRYYLGGLPKNCCSPPGGPSDMAQVKVMAKLDLIPAVGPTDYLLIQSLEALIAEAQSIRFSGIDGIESKKESAERHLAAVRYLNGLSVHTSGRTSPAFSFSPFGSARLEKNAIGTMI